MEVDQHLLWRDDVALDLGTTLLILGTFSHLTIQKARNRGENVKRQIFGRNASYFFALVFYASIIPGLIPEFQPYGVKGLIWLSVLLIAVLSRFRGEKKQMRNLPRRAMDRLPLKKAR